MKRSGAEKEPAEKIKGNPGGRQVQASVVTFGSDLLSELRVSGAIRGD